jgi:hypothetical protein
MGPFVVQAPGQGRKPLGAEDLPYGGGAEGAVALLEGLADLIDRVVLLAELDDEVAGGRFLGLGPRAPAGGGKEDRLGLAAEVVTQDVKGVNGVAEGAGGLFGWAPVDQEGAEGLVLAVFRQARLEEEAAELT